MEDSMHRAGCSSRSMLLQMRPLVKACLTWTCDAKLRTSLQVASYINFQPASSECKLLSINACVVSSNTHAFMPRYSPCRAIEDVDEI